MPPPPSTARLKREAPKCSSLRLILPSGLALRPQRGVRSRRERSSAPWAGCPISHCSDRSPPFVTSPSMRPAMMFLPCVQLYGHPDSPSPKKDRLTGSCFACSNVSLPTRATRSRPLSLGSNSWHYMAPVRLLPLHTSVRL